MLTKFSDLIKGGEFFNVKFCYILLSTCIVNYSFIIGLYHIILYTAVQYKLYYLHFQNTNNHSQIQAFVMCNSTSQKLQLCKPMSSIFLHCISQGFFHSFFLYLHHRVV